MTTVIGIVKALVGEYYAKDGHGDLVELHVGDKITKDMVVFGADGNSESAYIKISMLNLEEALVLTDLDKQAFDLSLIADNSLDEFVSPQSLNKALNAAIYAEDDATDAEKDGSVDETAAGEEAVVGHLSQDVFLQRNDEIIDVRATLRKAESENLINPNINTESLTLLDVEDTISPISNLAPVINISNSAPVLVEDSTTVGDIVVSYTLSDANNDAVTVILSDTVNYALDGNGNVVLTQAGADLVNAGVDLPAFTLTPNDGIVDGTVALIDPVVNAVNDNPVANPDTATTDEDTPVTINVLGNDTDVDGDTL
ncbi:Ig-like domain-containing protein, partial [Sulfurimonas sp.]